MVDINDDDLHFLNSSLQGTSRTFALAIPLLGAELRHQVGIAYLLFRVADSIEDAAGIAADRRQFMLQRLCDCLVPGEGGSFGAAAIGDGFGGLWPADSATERLMVATPRLLQLFHQLPPAAVASIRGARAVRLVGCWIFSAPDRLAVRKSGWRQSLSCGCIVISWRGLWERC